MKTQKMVSSVELEGFGPFPQCTQIPLGKLTVVTSSRPDTGKSWAVVRSLKWALFNDGPTFSTDDSKDEIRSLKSDGTKVNAVRVKVEFSDGSWLERSRYGTRNCYLINDGNETHEFNNVGSGFFEKVRELLSIGPVALDGKNAEALNIRDFFESRVFLLDRSPGQVDTVLSRLMGSDTIEDAQGLVGADLRSNRAELKTKWGLMEQVDEAIAGLPDIDKAQQVMSKVVAAQKLYNSAEEGIRHLENVILNYRTLFSSKESLSRVTKALEWRVLEAERLAVNIHSDVEVSSTIDSLRSITQQTSELSTETSAMSCQVRALEGIQAQVMALGEANQTVSETSAQLNAATSSYRKAAGSFRECSAAVQEAKLELGKAEQDFSEAMREARICPLCGSDTTHFHEAQP